MPPKNNVNPELDEICKRPENLVCADCGAKAPRWASVNLGVLVCIDCSGQHRNMGVHISVVKSVTLDKWNPKWISTVSKIGNRIARDYYEQTLPRDYQRPTEGDDRNKINAWIRNKYDRKDYAPRNKPTPGELVAQGRDPDVYGRDRGGDSDDDRRRRSDRRRDPSPEERRRPNRDKEEDKRRAPAQEAPKAKAVAAPQPAPKPVAPAPTVDLLGGDAPSSGPTTNGSFNAFQSQPPPQQSQQQNSLQQVNFFAGNTGNVAAPAAAPPNGGFPDLFAQQAPPQQMPPQQMPQQMQQAQVQDQKVNMLSNNLNQLYNQPAPDRFAAMNNLDMGNAGNMNMMGGMGNMNMMGGGNMFNPGMGMPGMGMGQQQGYGMMPGFGAQNPMSGFGASMPSMSPMQGMPNGGFSQPPASQVPQQSAPPMMSSSMPSSTPTPAASSQSTGASGSAGMDEKMKEIMESLGGALGGSKSSTTEVSPKANSPNNRGMSGLDAFSMLGTAAPSAPSSDSRPMGNMQPMGGMQQMGGSQPSMSSMSQMQQPMGGMQQMGMAQMGGMQQMGMQNMGMPHMGMQQMQMPGMQMQAPMGGYGANAMAPPYGGVPCAAGGFGFVS